MWSKACGLKSECVAKEEETLGEPQTPQGGFGFPQRLRERERKRAKRPRRACPNNQRKKRTTNTFANKGQVLKGTNPNNIPTPETKRPTHNTQHPFQRNLTKNLTQNQHCLGGLHRRVAGPMGRPAPSEETPHGDRGNEGSKDPPTTGTAPGGARTINHAKQVTLAPESWARLLAGPNRLK